MLALCLLFLSAKTGKQNENSLQAKDFSRQLTVVYTIKFYVDVDGNEISQYIH